MKISSTPSGVPLTFFAWCFWAAQGHLSHKGAPPHNFLGIQTSMQPQVVAHTLAKVEDDWRTQAAAFVDCNGQLSLSDDANTCAGASAAFHKSCLTIVSAMVAASGGEKTKIEEYLGDICSQPELQGWRHDDCVHLAASLSDAMSENSYDNRQQFDSESLCSHLWTQEIDLIKDAESIEEKRQTLEKAEEDAQHKVDMQKDDEGQEKPEPKLSEKAEEQSHKEEPEVAKHVDEARANTTAVFNDANTTVAKEQASSVPSNTQNSTELQDTALNASKGGITVNGSVPALANSSKTSACLSGCIDTFKQCKQTCGDVLSCKHDCKKTLNVCRDGADPAC